MKSIVIAICEFIKSLFMTKNDLAKEVERLVIPNSLDDAKDWFNLHLDCLIHLSQKHKKTYNSDFEEQGKIVLHMLFAKALSINNLLKGISYQKGAIKLNEIIDPTAIAVLVRNIFETVTIFHINYRFHSDPSTREIIYKLWVMSGLKYRQKSGTATSSAANQQKMQEELQQINDLETEIKSNPIYLALNPKEQGKLDTCMKDKKFQVTIENGKVNMLAWHQLIEKMGFAKSYHDQIYNYLSLYAHPSNPSVFQFSQMFNKSSLDFLGMAKFNLQLGIWLLSAFIADYLHFFPEALKYYEEQDDLTQIAVNFSNKTIRGNNYSINDSWKKMEG